MKILILKPSSLGDVVQALPVLRLLKRRFPQSEIYWWIELGLARLLQDDPDLAGIIAFDRLRWSRAWYWPELAASLSAMRQQEFDWVIDLQSLMRSGIVAWLVNGSLTIGLDDHREGARAFYDVIVPRPANSAHAVDWYLEVLRWLEVPVHEDFTWLPQHSKIAALVQERWKTPAHRWILIQPGARGLNKRWPAEHFAQLARLLSKLAPACKLAILGSASDRPLGQIIAQAAPENCLDLTGQTSLPEMVEWLRLSDLLVTNDTGPMHVAAALGKPVVALFGPTDPAHTGPYGQLENVFQLALPCVPCRKDSCRYAMPLECLRGISPEAVAARVLKILRPVNTIAAGSSI